MKRRFSIRAHGGHSRISSLPIIIGVVVMAIFGLLLWQYLDARADLRRLNDPNVAIEEETKSTEEEVAKIMVLPQGEQPTVANVSDVNQLKDRAFFANAQNGDKVLIYAESKKAILYRPATKQIVEVATYSSEEPLPDQPQ
jgi:hypothetical protein